MSKLHLEIEEIRVESFEVAEEEPARGTVHGHQPTYGDTCSCDCSADFLCESDPCSEYPHSCVPTHCVDTGCIAYC